MLKLTRNLSPSFIYKHRECTHFHLPKGSSLAARVVSDTTCMIQVRERNERERERERNERKRIDREKLHELDHTQTTEDLFANFRASKREP